MSPYVHSEGREAFNGQAFFSALPRVNGETKAHVSGVACDDGVDEVMAHWSRWIRSVRRLRKVGGRASALVW